MVLEIDVQGAGRSASTVPDALLSSSRRPRSDELERRLRGRGTEDEDDDRASGWRTAERELAQAAWFDHVVVNDDLDRAADEVAAIIEASRTR